MQNREQIGGGIIIGTIVMVFMLGILGMLGAFNGQVAGYATMIIAFGGISLGALLVSWPF